MIKKFTGPCSREAIDYTIKVVEDAIIDVLEMVCNQHMEVNAPKCVSIFKSDPIAVEKTDHQESIAFFLPLIEIFTQLGSLPEEN